MRLDRGLALLLVPSFLHRRADDSDLAGRLDELESAHRSLAREVESLRAESAENIELLTLLGVDAWLREIASDAKETGWFVTCSPKGIVFNHPEGADHTYRIEIPLAEERAPTVRMELRARIMCLANA